jgi:SAM-dependent methyltransferase
MQKYTKANIELWNELTAIHEKSKFYDLDGFRAGKISLKSIELNELGDVSGLSLLHLQCHFGLDTMSWARLGARVTDVDYSEKAIALAKSLSAELDIPADFICTDIYNLPQILAGEFDIIFTSYGVLCWLPDIKRWAQIISHFLKDGGVFYIIEMHPFNQVFNNEEDATDLEVEHPYFHSPEPKRWEPDNSYADKTKRATRPSYEWTHSLGDIINAIISADLRIEFLHEFPFCVYDCFPFMTQGDDGWWRLKNKDDTLPLMFSLEATK